MSYKVGEIVLVKFPFTNLKKAKKRPVLVVKSENNFGDVVCFQITSNELQTNLLKLKENDFQGPLLPIQSYIKYDKCFTINSEIIDKSLTTVNSLFLEKLKILFCQELF